MKNKIIISKQKKDDFISFVKSFGFKAEDVDKMLEKYRDIILVDASIDEDRMTEGHIKNILYPLLDE